jgi:hypothetical protein
MTPEFTFQSLVMAPYARTSMKERNSLQKAHTAIRMAMSGVRWWADLSGENPHPLNLALTTESETLLSVKKCADSATIFRDEEEISRIQTWR